MTTKKMEFAVNANCFKTKKRVRLIQINANILFIS